MNKSVQSMNLEKVLSELKVLKGSTPMYGQQAQPILVGQTPEEITAGINLNPPGGASGSTTGEPEVYGFVPGKKKKKKKEEESEPHLMKPSDLFK
jgi:hypothetical protein